jgi:hypothetical protein
MDADSNKRKVRDFLTRGFGEGDLTVVDQVFAEGHILRSPAIGVGEEEGTDYIKGAIEDIRRDGGEVRCSVEDQIAEGDSVTTSYTLSEDQGDHMGIMVSHFTEGKITRSLVVARDVNDGSTEDASTRRKVFN